MQEGKLSSNPKVNAFFIKYWATNLVFSTSFLSLSFVFLLKERSSFSIFAIPGTRMDNCSSPDVDEL